MSGTYVKLGQHNALCDRCQRKYKSGQLRKEWTGYMVCNRCWEPRHPQEFLKGRKEDEQVAWTRPDSTEDSIEYIGDAGKTLIAETNYAVQNWNTELTKDRVVILSTINAQKGDRFVIYKTQDNNNKLLVVSTNLDSGNTV